MTENATVTDPPSGESEPLAARVRDVLRRYNPLYVAPLAFLSIPADWADQLAFLDVFQVFWLCFLWVFVGPLADVALRSQVEEESEPTDWVEMGSVREMLVAITTMPLGLLNPLVVVQDLAQFGGSWVGGLVRHGGSLPDVDSYEQSVSYRLPVEGEWTVVNGSPEREYSHSWIYPSQRYAYDFVVTDKEGQTRPEGTDSTVGEYYCYDEPVLAPADGVVVDAFDSALESTRAGGFSHPASRDIRGGYVVVKHAEQEYSLLAHLEPGSVPVETGERVGRGQELGRCGHTGNSSEPHLHFQVQDHPNFEVATTLPVEFEPVEIESPGVAHDEDLVPGATVSDGVHEQSYIVEGQRVSHAGDEFESTPTRAAETTAATVENPTPLPSGVSVARTVKYAAFGLAVAGIVLFAARFVLSGWPLVGAIAAASAAGLAFGRVYRRRHGRDFTTRSPGVPLGLGAGAGLVAVATSLGLGSGALVGLLVLAGVVGYFGVAAYEGRRLAGLPAGSRS